MKQLFILLIFFSANISWAQMKVTQKVEMKWGEETKRNKHSHFDGVITYDKTGYYMLHFQKKGPTIDKYGIDLNLEKSYLIDLKKAGKKMLFEGISYFKDNLIVLSSFSDRNKKTNALYYQIVDKNTLVQKTGLTLLSELQFDKKSRNGDFGFATARDSSKMLIYTGMPFVKDGPEKFGFTVLDENLNKLWSKEVELPYLNKLFQVEDYDVSPDGNVFITGSEYKDKKLEKTRKGVPNYKYHILGYFNNGNLVKDYEVDLGDKFITDLSVSIGPDKNIICSGFFSENGSWSIGGVFYLTIDGTTKKVTKKSLKRFSEDFITEGWTKKEEKRAKRKAARKNKELEMYDYDLHDLVHRNDGGALLFAEQYYVFVSRVTTTDANGNITTREVYHYIYGDIIAVNISPEGEIDWATKIEKNQHTTNDGGYFSSFSIHVKHDKIFIIYNEHAKQFLDKETRQNIKRKDRRSMLTLLVEINSKGDVEKELLFNNKAEQVTTRPKVCEQINRDFSILYTQRRNKHKFLQLNF